MKRIVKAAVDYSQLSESILKDQIKEDLNSLKRNAEKLDPKNPLQSPNYNVALIMKELLEEIDDCYAAISKKSKKR